MQEGPTAHGERIDARNLRAFLDKGVSRRVGSIPVGTLRPRSYRSEPESEFDADREPRPLAATWRTRTGSVAPQYPESPSEKFMCLNIAFSA